MIAGPSPHSRGIVASASRCTLYRLQSPLASGARTHLEKSYYVLYSTLGLARKPRIRAPPPRQGSSPARCARTSRPEGAFASAPTLLSLTKRANRP